MRRRQPQTWLLSCVWLLLRSWGWRGGKAAWLRALTLTGSVDAVSGHGVFLHSLGAGGELREAGHEGAQHQDEAQGCHLVVERERRGCNPGHPYPPHAPEPMGAKGSIFFQESCSQRRR